MTRSLQNRQAFWLRRASQALRKKMDEVFSTYRLTAAQFDVLMNLWYEDGLEQYVLAERLAVTKASVTSLLDGLVERGLVERRFHPDDARVKQVFLTEQGWNMQADLDRASRRVQEQLLQGFSPKEAELLQEWLQRLVRNVEDEH